MLGILIRLAIIPLALSTAVPPAQPAGAQPASAQSPAIATSINVGQPSYVALVDLSLAAPVIVRATITRSRRIAASAAPGLGPGQFRLLITATVDSALIAPDAVPRTLSWLQDTPADARGRAPDLQGGSVLAWLRAPSSDGQTTLVAGNASQPWSAPLEARVRAIATEIRTGNVPVITGVTNGFRVPGTVAGEAESQFFLATQGNRPLTMVVLDRPGQQRQIQVASTDIIDESATSVLPDTLVWYRLACALPARLPASAGGADQNLANAWASAMASLGPCLRP